MGVPAITSGVCPRNTMIEADCRNMGWSQGIFVSAIAKASRGGDGCVAK